MLKWILKKIAQLNCKEFKKRVKYKTLLFSTRYEQCSNDEYYFWKTLILTSYIILIGKFGLEKKENKWSYNKS